MNSIIGNWLFRLAVIVSLAIPPFGFSPAIQSNQLAMVEPSACPPGGCAAGQRLTVRADYALSAYAPGDQENVQLCLYLPTNWIGGNDFQPQLTGEVTRQTYEPRADYCEAAPENYQLAGGLVTHLTDNRWSSDALSLSFRIGKAAAVSENGSMLLTVLENNQTEWTRTAQLALALTVVPSAADVYVANDAATCASASPCYVNSSGDLLGGIGTGLKDAIDAAPSPANIRILGSYAIKGETIRVDQAHIISGQSDATLTSSGSACVNPMLELTAGATLRGLNVNDGLCQNPGRDLLVVNSPDPVQIESNDLSGGNNALRVLPAEGNVTVRFNHISGNQGYAILREPGDAPGTVDAVANNLFGNRSGVQVECNGHGTVNHNFWGSGVNVTAAVSNCPVDAGKRLGAAILQSSAGPGVEAVQATVTAQKQYAFSNSVGFFRTGNGADFPLFIVNHGRGAAENVPFTNPGDLIPCSNYWDVFLPTGVNPPGTLDLFFDYASDASCVAAIELSTEYCKNSDAARYPLWWHDPATGATSGWDTTSSTGQTTTCRTNDDELQVSIDASGRPNLANDLKFAPFVVAIHSAALTDFKAEPGNKQVKVTWRAASEVNTRGYFLHRSTQADSGYQVVSDFFPAKGGDMVAANYEHLDQSLTNDTTYYYRLEIVSENLVSTFTTPISAMPAVPTATPTPTRTNTPTITPTRTVTPTRTATITRTPWVYRTSTLAATRTPYRFPTIAGYRSPTPRVTRTPTPRFGVTQSPSPRVTTRSTAGSGYPAAGTPSLEATSAGSYPQPGATGQSSVYPGPAGATLPPDATDPTGAAGAAGTAAASLTPTRVGTAVAAPTQPDEPGGPLAFAGLLAGAVLGLLVLGAGGWYLWSRSMLPPFFAFLPPPSAGGAGSGSTNPPGSLE